jgi:hypothetical protein
MVSRSLLTAAGVVAAIVLGTPPPVAAQTTTRVSLASTGIETHGHNYWGFVQRQRPLAGLLVRREERRPGRHERQDGRLLA